MYLRGLAGFLFQGAPIFHIVASGTVDEDNAAGNFLFQGGEPHALAGANPLTDCVPIAGCPAACGG